ncbi:MAG: helix-turn-helix transcriptional regulator [Tenericutes bacterium]|jgi:transcriptional regulator with XRE-family HTH domain|nr:helix-turn-helix transcriptional regulator [Mycoplasmatota bacterium]
MKRKVYINLRKRKEKKFEFYYMVYGQMIKKRRLELNYTQEFVARAICSDTYVSKAENSQVIIGEEQLFHIMEKLNIPKSEFGKPETLVHYLEKIITYFYRRDINNYKKLVDKVEGYHFHVVIEIIRLGYHILKKEYQQAEKISNQLVDYLKSMDDLAFSIFLCFSSVLNIKLNNIRLAKYLINAMYILHLEYPELINLYTYSKYIVCGKSHMLVKAEEVFNQLVPQLINTYNSKYLKEVMVWKALFREYNKEGQNIDYMDDFTEDIDEDLVDEFLLVRAFNTSKPEKYTRLMKNKESEYYLIGLYLCSKQAMKNKNKVLFKEYQKEMSELHYKIGSKIDYNNLLNLEKKNNGSFYKEYLVNPCFKIAKEKENIFFMNQICDKVVDTLKNKNRYKDALSYKEKLQAEIKSIQSED